MLMIIIINSKQANFIILYQILYIYNFLKDQIPNFYKLGKNSKIKSKYNPEQANKNVTNKQLISQKFELKPALYLQKFLSVKVYQSSLNMSKARQIQFSQVSDFTRQQYTHYLEDQLQKMSSFMLYQKKENQKHNLLTRTIQEQNQKIKFLNDKVHLVQLYQNQNLKNHQKLFQSTQKAISFEKRIDQIQNVLYYQKNSFGHNNNFYSSQSEKHFKKDLLNQIQNKLKNMNEDLFIEMNKIQKNLVKKLKKIEVEFQLNKNHSFSRQKNKVDAQKDNMSPLQTNYSQNGNSRAGVSEKQKSGKQQLKKIEKRINSFIDHKKQKFQEQLHQKHMKQDQSVSNYSSMHQSKIYCDKQQRSPISVYMEIQNQYNSNKQNFDFSNKRGQPSKSFYSTSQIQKIRKKNKTKRQSKSKSKSNRSKSKDNSFDEIVNKKLTGALKIAGRQSKQRFSKRNKKQITSKRQKKQNSFTKKQINTKLNQKSVLSSKQKDDTKFKRLATSKINQKSIKRAKSKSRSLSKNSQLSISQNSNCSHSNSRNKKYLDQKQYLKFCNKFH